MGPVTDNERCKVRRAASRRAGTDPPRQGSFRRRSVADELRNTIQQPDGMYSDGQLAPGSRSHVKHRRALTSKLTEGGEFGRKRFHYDGSLSTNIRPKTSLRLRRGAPTVTGSRANYGWNDRLRTLRTAIRSRPAST